MKKLQITALSIVMFSALSCTADKNEANTQTSISNNPVSGKIYNQNFVVSGAGGKASDISESGVEKVNIYLTSTAQGCNAPQNYEFPVTLLVPKAVGVHTTNVAAFFKDPATDSFVNISTLTVEITSIGATVKGKVLASSLSEGNSINGTFEVPYCD
jgi:hypothetical protein